MFVDFLIVKNSQSVGIVEYAQSIMGMDVSCIIYHHHGNRCCVGMSLKNLTVNYAIHNSMSLAVVSTYVSIGYHLM